MKIVFINNSSYELSVKIITSGLRKIGDEIMLARKSSPVVWKNRCNCLMRTPKKLLPYVVNAHVCLGLRTRQLRSSIHLSSLDPNVRNPTPRCLTRQLQPAINLIGPGWLNVCLYRLLALTHTFDHYFRTPFVQKYSLYSKLWIIISF